ncbi:MscL family protein [Mycoplasma leonicaptivi]|uniref:large conductance mechanosensitive channel protein MscL n=1 Tax=Mycoplasma leonicaptivi TaxID=36742 RepID=UPI000685984B|nr:MscL family protein [Mycoplasma leonicaptivi]
MKNKKIIKSSLKEALTFFKKGNMLILAIGFIAGAVFSGVVSSLANDVIMSAIAHNILGENGKLDGLVWHGIKYGKFLGALLNFVIVTFLLFVLLFNYYLIKKIIKIRREKYKKEEEIKTPEKPLTTDELILQELQKINQNMEMQNK